MNRFIFVIVIFMALLGVSCNSTRFDIYDYSLEENGNVTTLNIYEEHSSYEYTDETSYKKGFTQGLYRSKEPIEKGVEKISKQTFEEKVIDVELDSETHYLESKSTSIVEERTQQSSRVSKHERGRKAGKRALNFFVALVTLRNM